MINLTKHGNLCHLWFVMLTRKVSKEQMATVLNYLSLPSATSLALVFAETLARNGQCAFMFHRKMVAFLKTQCWSRNKQKSDARKLLEKRFSGIGSSSRRRPQSEQRQVHPNACVFARGVCELPYLEFYCIASLRSRHSGNREWRVSETRLLLQTWGLTQEPGSDDLESCSEEFQDSVEYIKNNIDVHLPYRLRLYVIESSFERLLHKNDFKSGYVEVSWISNFFDDHDGEQLFWEGAAKELASKKSNETNRGGIRRQREVWEELHQVETTS